MIELNENNLNDCILKQMYNILINNLFITYPKFLENRNKYDNIEKYEKWSNMIKETKDYNVLVYKDNEDVLGFLNFSIIDNKLWISEAQIKDKYKNKKILKKLLKKFVSLQNVKNFDEVTIHINTDNILSYKIFIHIGFEPIGNTLYKISMNNLINWINY